MIFASDLDRTLIYSQRAIEELDRFVDLTKLVPVERKEGKAVSYMTPSSFETLKKISEMTTFVPITTRTTEQYKRITIFEDDIHVRYAVTSNGANILYNGQPDEDWKQQINKQMTYDSMSQKELIEKLSGKEFSLKGTMKFAENLFFYYILDERISKDEKNSISSAISSYGWRTSLQGKKLYFIPNCISKGSALKFIQEKEQSQMLAGAGDSILDFDFLQYCNHRYVPVHGELAAEDDLEDFTITKQKGVMAGEELLVDFLSQLLLRA